MLKVCTAVIGGHLFAASLLLAACDTPGSSNSPVVGAFDATGSPDTVSGGAKEVAQDIVEPKDSSAPDAPTPDTAPDIAVDSGTPELPIPGDPCPPTGPFGKSLGDTLADVTVYDCDGNARQLHAFCGNDATLVVTFAGWCNACRSYAESLANLVYETITDNSFTVGAALVITEKANGSEPDAAYCAEIRDQYGLEMPVFYEPTNAIESNWGVTTNSQEVVVGRGMQLYWKNQGGGWAHPESVNKVSDLLDSL